MVAKLANNASSTLAGSINSSVTSLSVASGDAAKFPALGAGEWFPLTVVDTAGNMEIMKVTARTGAALTVVRGQEGTTAKSFPAGSKCDLRLTAAAQIDHEHAIAAIVGLVAALAAKADDTEITDLYAALGLKADATAVALALAGKASLLSDGVSDNSFDDTSELAFVDGTTQKRGTLLGLISSIFKSTRAIANGVFLSASFAWENATGFRRTHSIVGHTANRNTNWPNRDIDFETLGVTQSSGQLTVTAGGLLQFTHTLGAAPKQITVDLVCTGAEHGWAVGDVVKDVGYSPVVSGSTSTNPNGPIAYVDAASNPNTVANVRWGSFASAILTYANKTTGAAANLTYANWKAIINVSL